MSQAEIREMYQELSRMMSDGTLRVPVEATYGIDDIAEAVAHAGREGRDGKILLTPNGPVA